MERTVKILNESGLHARPAALLVKTASQFKSDIKIEFNGNTLNAKSIMNVMSMGLRKDDEIKLIIDGPDAEEAMKALVELIESKFNEA
ncbi:phosphocarrier protein [Caminicella sporogenes DSM 14501]|uniref:Phosphocarrier protein HPr n=1 Tax=Caminicella sporogenes DSM 14501 TaxID=1121266 RepID=A0A1M6Q9S4_9FIRM|nr:HPr family phosphocarrier protein [Caminicella sporogenes]RKD23634.1 phosphocarrier protein HPr [Caminicella sporogenes]SHK17029.1 phosphocarrier protein [Caminicella sporogenes DSM 14501]